MIITDGDVAIAIAIRAVFPSSRHVLCVYHLSLNFKTHIYPLFANDNEAWLRQNGRFWHIAKETDVRSRDTFDAEFDPLIEALADLDIEPDTDKWKKRESAIAWLESLRTRRERWAYRFTWSEQTLGANSSQVILFIYSYS